MPYKVKSKQLKYLALWRKEHPHYMREYARKNRDARVEATKRMLKLREEAANVTAAPTAS